MKEIGMKSTSAIISALLAVTQACWMIEPVQAQPGEHSKPNKAHKPHKAHHSLHPQHRNDTDMPRHEAIHKTDYNGGLYPSEGIFWSATVKRPEPIMDNLKTGVIAHPGLPKKVETACHRGRLANGSVGSLYPLGSSITKCRAVWS
jgi:hypothetical protein